MGSEMQFIELDLGPGQAAVGEAGSLFYVDDGIVLDTVFGDGSQQQAGIFDKLIGAGKRALTGASLFTTVYTNQSSAVRRIAFSAPYPGKIIAVDLAQLGGSIICQKDAFLCAARGVSIGVAFQRRLGAGFFGGDGFIMQNLAGDGLAFFHSGGTIVERDLAVGETLRLESGCLVAYQPSIDFDIQYVGQIKTALFGGEGLFFAVLRGPGRVWMQSLPFSRLASRIFAAAPQAQERTGSAAASVVTAGGLIGGASILSDLFGGGTNNSDN
ncbi:MAG: TIGR00266 family protein [Burkholderiaceae bacterium]